LFGDLFEGDTGGREGEGGRPVDNGKTTFAELVFSHEGMHGGVLLVICCGVGAAVLNHHATLNAAKNKIKNLACLFNFLTFAPQKSD